jgi:hypothetical protein
MTDHPSWKWTKKDLAILLDFNEDLDPTTVDAGIEITVTGASMRRPPVLSLPDKKHVQAVLVVEQPPDPNLTNTIDFKLPKATLRTADGRSFDSDVTFSVAITS